MWGKKRQERKQREAEQKKWADQHNRKKKCLQGPRGRACLLPQGHWGKHSWER